METWIQSILLLGNNKQKESQMAIHICVKTAFIVVP